MTQAEYDKAYSLLVEQVEYQLANGLPENEDAIEATFSRKVDKLDNAFMTYVAHLTEAPGA
jgi:hypothetical protein